MAIRRWFTAFLALLLVSAPLSGMARALTMPPDAHHCCPKAPSDRTTSGGQHSQHGQAIHAPDCFSDCTGCQHCGGVAALTPATAREAVVLTDAFDPDARVVFATFVSPIDPRPPRAGP